MNASRQHRYFSALVVVLLLTGFRTSPVCAESAIRDNDRILFIGDSITFQGAGNWVFEIGEGLTLAHPTWKVTLIPLGANGSNIGAWIGMEKKCRDRPFFLDAKKQKYDIKGPLDAGADILVIMLGMNDVLPPSSDSMPPKNNPAASPEWGAHYHDLIAVLKARVHPRLVALATITPCTEDLDSPKNQVEAILNAQLAALAKQAGAIVLPTHETMVDFLARGRGFKPDFHVTADCVHLNGAGALAVAVGMLRGLGEADAAQYEMQKRIALIIPAVADLPTLSYTLKRQADSPDDAKQSFTIHYQWTPPTASTVAPTVRASAPDGWSVTPSSLSGGQGDFQASGPLDHLANTITLHGAAGDLMRDTEIRIPAGWRIATGGGKGLGWSRGGTSYDPAKDHLAIDDLLAQDGAFLAPLALAAGKTAPWKLYISTFNFTGRGAAGSIDMAAVSYFKQLDLACGARWIYSVKDRPVDVTLSTQAFASMAAVSLRLNGDVLYQGIIRQEPGGKVTVQSQLRRGWNRLAFKSSFIQWLWQFSIDVTSKPGDDLADVRYATAPPPGTMPVGAAETFTGKVK
jgi:lysophospholipase L1-like esterase